jgi:hypothetical protein
MSWGQSKSQLNVADTNTLMQQGLSSNLAMGPQVVEQMKKLGPEYAAAVLQANMGFNPTLKGLADLINAQTIRAAGGMPKFLSDYAQNQFRNAQGLRGFGDSPMSSLAEANTMGGTYDTWLNNLETQANNFARNPGMQMNGQELQRGLGLDMPTIPQAYDAQFQGQSYQNDVNTYLLNQRNAYDNQTASRIGSAAGVVMSAIPELAPLAGAVTGATGSTTQDVSDTSLAKKPNAYTGSNDVSNQLNTFLNKYGTKA